jgi:hypothetical protein
LLHLHEEFAGAQYAGKVMRKDYAAALRHLCDPDGLQAFEEVCFGSPKREPKSIAVSLLSLDRDSGVKRMWDASEFSPHQRSDV